MELDQGGIDFIQSFEGYSDRPYQDQRGKWTIGWGHTEGVTAQTPIITREQALLLFEEDIEEAERAVNDWVSITLSQNEFDALVSFVFNEGAGKFRTSTLLVKLNNGDRQGAAKEFDRWIYCKDRKTGESKIDNGLVARRMEEKALFLQGFELQRAVNPDELI